MAVGKGIGDQLDVAAPARTVALAQLSCVEGKIEIETLQRTPT
jgi:enamine deaminase RidA (YjgF/YER057c/UK114 family)